MNITTQICIISKKFTVRFLVRLFCFSLFLLIHKKITLKCYTTAEYFLFSSTSSKDCLSKIFFVQGRWGNGGSGRRGVNISDQLYFTSVDQSEESISVSANLKKAPLQVLF